MLKRLKAAKVSKEVKVSEKRTFVTVPRAGEQLDCSEQVIRSMVRRGELQGAKIGGRFKIVQSSIDAVLHRVFGHPISERSSSPAMTALSAE